MDTNTEPHNICLFINFAGVVRRSKVHFAHTKVASVLWEETGQSTAANSQPAAGFLPGTKAM